MDCEVKRSRPEGAATAASNQVVETINTASPENAKALQRVDPHKDKPTTLEASHDALDNWLRSGSAGLIKWDEFEAVAVLEKPTGRVRLDDAEITRLITDLQAAGFRRINRNALTDVIHMVATDNAFDSAKEWLDNLPAWDGTNRIEHFLPDYLGTRCGPYELAVSRYLWTAMVARIRFPGIKADMVPVLVGPQGTLKSTVLSVIAPKPDYCGEACLADRASNLGHKCLGRTLVVWEEMRGIRGKFDADEVKTFISSPYVEIRSGSKHGMSRYQRRFIIVGTSNTKEILADPTGNRRYLPFDVPNRIRIEKVIADKIQLWAEAVALVEGRIARVETEIDFKDAERLAVSEHKAFSKEARWYGEKLLAAWLLRNGDRFTTEDALHEIGLSSAQITRREKLQMAETLRQLGYEKKPTRVQGWKNPQQRWRKN